MARTIVTFDDLVAIARRVGVTVVAAPSSHRGQIGEMGTIYGLTLHHTGTPNSFRAADEYPDFNVVKEGRPGLWNSLSALGLGRHTTIYVFSEDISWHAGAWLWEGVTDGNGHYMGIEAAGVGDWTPFQRAVYPRLVASFLLFIGESNPRKAAPRHLDGAMPRGRKSDAANFSSEFLPGKNFYESVEWLMANPAYININYKGGPTVAPEEDDMSLFMLQVRKGDTNGGRLTFCGPGFAQPLAGGSAGAADDTELRGRQRLPVYVLSNDLCNRVIADIRAGVAVRDDLADEEPAAQS